MEAQVHHVKTVAEYRGLVDGSGEKLVVVDFSATWCPPCRVIAPVFADLSKKYTDVVFVHVDVDELQDLDDVQKVSGVPTFKFFKKGVLITEFSGANAAKLEETIAQNK